MISFEDSTYLQRCSIDLPFAITWMAFSFSCNFVYDPSLAKITYNPHRRMELQDWLVNINNNKECEACMSLSTLNGATSACFERNSLITRLRSPPKSSIFLDSVKLCTSPDPPACYIFDDNLQQTSLNGEKTSRSQIKRRNKSSGYNLCRPPFCIILVRYKQTHLLAEASHEGPRGRFPLSAYNNES